MSTLLVTGASGHLGRTAIESLLKSGCGHKVIAGSRNPARLADLAALDAEIRTVDFEDIETLDAAFAGVDRVLIVSTDALDKSGRRVAQHKNAIDAATRAGVKHVVYTSFTNSTPDSAILLAPDHCATEQLLDQSPLGYTILRNNFYAENLLGALPHAVATGRWFAAAGSGAMGYVARADAGAAAAAALASSFDGRRTLDITGPSALTHEEVATIVSEITGKPLAYVPVDEAAVTQGLIGAGFPEPIAKIFASFDTATAKGELEVVSTAVDDLTGREAQSLRDFLAANKAAIG